MQNTPNSATAISGSENEVSLRITRGSGLGAVLSMLLVGGSIIRLILALYNYRSNDNHIEVSDFIERGIGSGMFPTEFVSCWECYHPKLYHGTVALLHLLFPGLATPVMLAQLVSVLCGVGTLWIVARWCLEHAHTHRLMPLIFAWIAFNPDLVAINVQATNDSLAIFLGVFCFYWFGRFLDSRSLRAFIWSMLGLFLGLMTKGNLLVYLPALFLTGLYVLCARPRNGRSLFRVGTVLAGLVLVLALVVEMPRALSPYRQYIFNAMENGGVAAVNFRKAPPPSIFDESYVGRPGITSIRSGYLTFRLLSMMETPHISQGPANFELHRTSLFSQLYGRYHSIFFAQWPWPHISAFSEFLARASLGAGLLPLFFLLAGLLVSLALLIQRAINEQMVFSLLIVAGYYSMICLFTFEHRGFDSMKTIYLFPGLLGFLFLQLRGAELYDRLIERGGRLRTATALTVWGTGVSLLAVYLAEELLLLNDLTRWWS